MSKADELQKAILNNIPDQAWLKDCESRYILINEAFMAACGLPEMAILNKTPLDVWPPDWGQEYIDTDQKVISLGQRIRYEEGRPGADGTPRWFDTIKTPVLNEQGEVIGTTGISRDITDRKQAEQELARLNRLYRFPAQVLRRRGHDHFGDRDHFDRDRFILQDLPGRTRPGGKGKSRKGGEGSGGKGSGRAGCERSAATRGKGDARLVA